MADTKESTAVQPGLDGYFRITARGSTFGQEIRGGFTTFFTMAYIVVLNPLILGFVPDKDGNYLGGGTEPNLVAIAAATALVAGIMTFAMGSLARFPIAIAAGLGLNAFVAFGLVGGGLFTWPEAMGLIVIEGVIVLLLVLTKLRIKFLYAVPLALKKAIAAGIGLFLAYIAFWDAKLVLPDASGATPGSFGLGGGINSWPTVIFLFGILLGGILLAKKVKGALLITIAVSTVLAFIVEAIANLGRSRQQTTLAAGRSWCPRSLEWTGTSSLTSARLVSSALWGPSLTVPPSSRCCSSSSRCSSSTSSTPSAR